MTTRNRNGAAAPDLDPTDDPRLSHAPEGPLSRPPAGSLPLPRLLGQMLLAELRPAEHLKSAARMEEIRALVRERGVGGFHLSGGDVFETPALLASLQQVSPFPLLVAADFESDLAPPIRGITVFPSNLAVGATRSEDLARLKGLVTAAEARALGIHLLLGPVADCPLDPRNPAHDTRAFGEDPALVARLAVAFAQGCREKGVLACARHFPGMGDATSDTPLDLPTLHAAPDRLRAADLLPFSELIRTGVDAVLTGPLRVDAIDRRYPASLSPAVVTDLLRRELGFTGLALADVAPPGGLAGAFLPEEAPILAAAAGNDALLVPSRPGQALAAMEGAVRSGRLPEAAIRASAQRLLEIKSRLNLRASARPEVVERLVGTRDHLAAAQRVADASITLVKDAGLLPVLPHRYTPLIELRVADEGAPGNREVFGEELRRRFGILTTLRVATGQDTTPALLRLKETIRSKPKAVLVVGLFARAANRGGNPLDPALAAFLQSAMRAVPASVVVSFGSPHVLRQIPEAPAFVCGYADGEATQRAAGRVLCGDLAPAGKLPVTLTPEYRIGHGLT